MPRLILLSLCLALIAAAPAPKRPYMTAHDRPLKTIESLLSYDEDADQYRVEFDGIKGSRVPAFLYVPKNGRSKHPAVLLQYGSGGSKKTNYIVAIGREFVARGFVVLTIDVPNKGDRKNETSEWIDKRAVQTMGDYSRAIDYLFSRPDVETARIGYMGISWGAITGIPFVAHDHRIKAMASLVGGGNFLGFLPPLLAAVAKDSVSEYDPVNHVALIAPRPLLLLNVTNDNLVPRFLSESLHKAAGNHGKKIWLETDHFFSGLDRIELTHGVIDFMEESLGLPNSRRDRPGNGDRNGGSNRGSHGGSNGVSNGG